VTTEPTFATHSWLPAVVPANATRFRVTDPDLAYTLGRAGARLVEEDPDVEIAPLDALAGEAPVVIVQLDGRLAVAPTRMRQAAVRIAASAGVRVRAAEIRRALRRRGYAHVAVLPWDRDDVIRVAGLKRPRHLSIAERLPRRVLLVGSRKTLGATALERAVAEAEREAGRPLEPTWPLPRAGSMVLLSAIGVLRVALGPGGHRIDAQKAALSALAAHGPPTVVTERTPMILADGRTGLVRWSLEQRLRGNPAPHALDRAMLDECRAFLVSLHALGDGDGDGDRGGTGTAARQAEVVADVLPERARAGLRAAARRMDEQLAGVTLGFGHGDFCTSNLLVADGRLAGVVDWEGAGGGRLPLLDFIHLHLLTVSRANVYEWGGAVVRYLLPTARDGGSALGVDVWRRLGIPTTSGQLDAYAGAYWLDRVSYQLELYVERRRDRLWIERNVEQVVEALRRRS
jgi:aminoglycoside phosphotransferase (APT) family kinase protein